MGTSRGFEIYKISVFFKLFFLAEYPAHSV